MSGVQITPASFNQAYRAYAIEQGNDVSQATQKSADTATVNSAEHSDTGTEDEVQVSISPEAARMYAEDLKRQSTVTKGEGRGTTTDRGTATYSEEAGDADHQRIPDKDDGEQGSARSK